MAKMAFGVRFKYFAASPEETWIMVFCAAALKQATADERTRALDLLKSSIEQPRSGR
jgi:hypothetical protein